MLDFWNAGQIAILFCLGELLKVVSLLGQVVEEMLDCACIGLQEREKLVSIN